MSISVRRNLTRRLAVLLFGVAALTTDVQAQDVHKDARLGFQLRVPRGWKQIPMRTDEAWIVGKYVAPRPERSVDNTSGYTLEAVPELVIVAIIDPKAREAAKEKPPEEAKQKEGEGEGEGEEEVKELLEKTYRDYPEYLKENYPHGHFIEKEEPGKHGDLAVTRFEIKAEAQINFAERKVITWVFETEIAKIAVQVEVMADAYKKHQAAIQDTLASFKVIPRTQPLTVVDSTGGFLSWLELSKLTPAERKLKRVEAQNAEFARMRDGLPEEWTATEIDGVFVVNHVDERFANKVVDQVRAIYAWLNESFPEIGRNEHARYPIVRICKDGDEENAFRKGTGMYGVGGTHLVTHKGRRDDSWEWEYIGGRTLDIWLLERDPKVWAAMPRWLAVGLRQVVCSAKLQTGKLSFEMGDLERAVREDLPRGDDDSISVRTLITLGSDEFDAFGKRKDWKPWCEAIALTRYFVGARSKKTRELFGNYLNNMALVVKELEDAEGKDGLTTKEAANEEEEEKLFKEREDWLKKRERAIIDKTLERTFAGWDTSQWKGLDREFRRSL
jgi:hypothetical protein